MERHLTTNTALLVALFAAHREALRESGLNAAEVARIRTYLRGSRIMSPEWGVADAARRPVSGGSDASR